MVTANNIIPFKELATLCNTVSDTNNLVWLGLLLTDEDIPEVEKFFKETGLIDRESKIEYVAKVGDNVLGDKGRTDYYFRLSGKGVINPLVRLQIADLKWLHDFVDNYHEQYHG